MRVDVEENGKTSAGHTEELGLSWSRLLDVACTYCGNSACSSGDGRLSGILEQYVHTIVNVSQDPDAEPWECVPGVAAAVLMAQHVMFGFQDNPLVQYMGRLNASMAPFPFHAEYFGLYTKLRRALALTVAL